MKSIRYWQHLRQLNRKRRRDWLGWVYIRARRCICGEIQCECQGVCHCGCGETTVIAATHRHGGLPASRQIAGLPAKWVGDHWQQVAALQRWKPNAQTAAMIAQLQKERRCSCSTADCPYWGYCHCGCGQRTPLARETHLYWGQDKLPVIAGWPLRYRVGHQPILQRGRRNANFKGQDRLVDGYRQVYAPQHPRAVNNYVREHILIMEQHLGRPLRYYGKSRGDNEIVHHINGNRADNRLENLQVMTAREHSAMHCHETQRRCPFPRPGSGDRSILTDEQLAQLRRDAIAMPYTRVAKKYGVHPKTVANIVNGRTNYLR